MIEVTTHRQVVIVKGTVSLGSFSTHVYLFLTDGMLIDTGPQSLLRDLADFYGTYDFEQVALTHSHEDHTGTAAWIQQNKPVPLYIHPSAIDTCAKPGDYPEYRKLVWGVRDRFQALPLGSSLETNRYRWKVIHTPGHADEHVVFLNQDLGILFSGDLFVTPKPKIIMRQESIPTILSSIRSVLRHDFQEMFCCHAGYVPDGRRLLTMKLEYLEEVSGKVWEFHREGCEIPEITRRLFPEPLPLTYLSDHEWDAEHIVRSILADSTASPDNE